MDKKEALEEICIQHRIQVQPKKCNAIEGCQQDPICYLFLSVCVLHQQYLSIDSKIKQELLVHSHLIEWFENGKWFISFALFNFIIDNLPLGMLQMKCILIPLVAIVLNPFPHTLHDLPSNLPTILCVILSRAPDQFNFDSQCPPATKPDQSP